MAETTLRRARKTHSCNSCGQHGAIRPGDEYLVGTIFPGDDTGAADLVGHPVQHRECQECATRYGRGHRFTTTEEATDGE
ncbi:hypothetical protein [Nocardia cyriacigeorgica]|uniref:hypothetical protein n=1 Tax=Nocardia cyriacigeorgica TaxID=135487 RepID=UPI0024557921|nr:hypothetical protein [Nocardia cyriacigeorgica]